HSSLHSFPTRRSSDLVDNVCSAEERVTDIRGEGSHERCCAAGLMYTNVKFLKSALGLRLVRLLLVVRTGGGPVLTLPSLAQISRSEEHTSELQSRGHL